MRQLNHFSSGEIGLFATVAGKFLFALKIARKILDSLPLNMKELDLSNNKIRDGIGGLCRNLA